ncbi:hypothetical protein PMI41_02486 [Phyllobacterium sp. YR531]|nr:hypothetical protein PMI41_02486 [Phyllobacterium sp. YR531]
MARWVRSLIARDDSQLIPRALGRAAALAGDAERVRIDRFEGEDFGAAEALLDGQAIARQRLAADDVAQVVGEVLERRERAGLGVEMREIEAPAELLLAAMLAHQAIEPALQAARQAEIVAVDGQHERVVENGGVEPVRHDQFEAQRPAARIGALLPLVDPGEAVHPPFGRLADRRRHRRRLETVERGLQTVVVAQGHATADELQNFVGRGRHQTRWPQAGVSRLDDLGGRPDQDVGVPDGGHAVFGNGLHTDNDGAGLEVDRRQSLRLAEREERVRHQVLRVARREIAGQRPEEIELLAFAAVMARRHPLVAQRCGAELPAAPFVS